MKSFEDYKAVFLSLAQLNDKSIEWFSWAQDLVWGYLPNLPSSHTLPPDRIQEMTELVNLYRRANEELQLPSSPQAYQEMVKCALKIKCIMRMLHQDPMHCPVRSVNLCTTTSW